MGCSVKGLIIDCLYFMEICNTTDLVKHDVEAEGKGNDEKGIPDQKLEEGSQNFVEHGDENVVPEKG